MRGTVNAAKGLAAVTSEGAATVAKGALKGTVAGAKLSGRAAAGTGDLILKALQRRKNVQLEIF